MQIQTAKAGYKLLKLNKYSSIVAAEYPEYWSFIELGDPSSGKFQNGVNKEKEDYGKGCLFVNILDVFREFTIDPNKLHRVKVSEQEIQNYKLEVGDIILDRSSNIFETVGYPAYFPGSNESVVFSGFTFRYRPVKTTWDSKFLTYLLMSAPIRKLVTSISTKSANSNVNQESYKKIIIPCPPIMEQQKIASMLSNVDSLINQIQKIIEQTQRLKKGSMQKLLTKGIGHTKFKKIKGHYGKIIEIPQSWNVTGIYDCCSDIFLGLTSKVDYVSKDGMPLVRAKDIASGRLLFDDIRYISEKQHLFLTKYHKPKKGDVLVSKSGTLGVCALVDTDKEFSIYESIIVLQPKKAVITSEFLLSLMRSESLQIRLFGDKVGSTVGHINLIDFRKLKISLPPINEQHKIASILSNIDATVQKHQEHKSQLETLKKGLMQKLLTGQIRVKLN